MTFEDLIGCIKLLDHPLVFVLDDFEKFACHPQQSLLYSLFELCNLERILIVGLTMRTDVVELLEKRVKSRFSQTIIYVQPAPSFGSEGFSEELEKRYEENDRDPCSIHSENLSQQKTKPNNSVFDSLSIPSITLLIALKRFRLKCPSPPATFESIYQEYQTMLRLIDTSRLLNIKFTKATLLVALERLADSGVVSLDGDEGVDVTLRGIRPRIPLSDLRKQLADTQYSDALIKLAEETF